MMMFEKQFRIIFTAIISLVWLVNGLYCKVLNFVPRHQLIVARILGEDYARLFTVAIGVAEIMMVIWIVSKIRSRFCAVFQMIVVGVMNILEFILVPDLLLFGRFNIVFAALFIALIYTNEFVLIKKRRYTFW
jgi:hypothetical protein